MKNKVPKIPIVKPTQFDKFLFGDWTAIKYEFYEKFHIERIEIYKMHLQLPNPPHRRSVYFLIFLTKGKVVRTNGLNQYELSPGHLFILPADQITSIEYFSEDAEGYYCHFLPEIFNHLPIKIDLQKEFSFFRIMGNPLLVATDPLRIKMLFSILENENSKNNKGHFELIPLYLFTLLTELKTQLVGVESTKKNASAYLTQRYKNALSELIYELKTVSDFAKYLNVTPNHLHKSSKATTGKSAHELLDEMRILEAKVLLKQTDLSIGEIAYKIGKFDPSDFSRFFKSNTNTTPKQYRKDNN